MFGNKIEQIGRIMCGSGYKIYLTTLRCNHSSTDQYDNNVAVHVHLSVYLSPIKSKGKKYRLEFRWGELR